MSQKLIYVAMWDYEIEALLQHLEQHPHNQEFEARLRKLIEEVPNA